MFMKPTNSLVIMVLGLLLPFRVGLTHGEDHPGPHGGEIRMPGAFHTELKKVNTKQLKIYLLDMDFKSPSVKESKVEAVLQRGTSTFELTCKPVRNYFLCKTAKGTSLKSGDQILVTSSRAGSQGGKVTYTLK